MLYFWIGAGVAFLVILVLVIAYICYRMAFYAPRKPAPPADEIQLPTEPIYDVFRESMLKWAKEVRAMPYEDMTITSFDGLTLHGKYYEYTPGAPVELMFHGYRGSAERDLPGGVQRCFQVGRSCLLVDQRCSGKSGGHVITFGINEHRDCLDWVEFMLKRFGPDVKIILTGISMGAATVLMAGGCGLPENVIGILADCGYNSAKDIIKKVIKQMGLPVNLSYPFVKLGARLYGHFDLEQTSPEAAMRKCAVPVIFYHGEDDDFVPCSMSRINYDACVSRKRLVTIPGAGHGLSYPVAPEEYLCTLREFFGPDASHPEKGDIS